MKNTQCSNINYVPCFYDKIEEYVVKGIKIFKTHTSFITRIIEKIFNRSIIENSIVNCTWKDRFTFILLLYMLMEAIFTIVSILGPNDYYGPALYRYAGLTLGTILFWPLAIIYNSHSFHFVCDTLFR